MRNIDERKRQGKRESAEKATDGKVRDREKERRDRKEREEDREQVCLAKVSFIPFYSL